MRKIHNESALVLGQQEHIFEISCSGEIVKGQNDSITQ